MRIIIMICCATGIVASILTHNLTAGCFAFVALLGNYQLYGMER